MPVITSLTVTAKIGPAQQATALVFNDAIAYNIKVAAQTLEVFRAGIPNPEYFDLTAITSVATTVSGGNYVVVFS